jgi:hypothetical protein
LAVIAVITVEGRDEGMFPYSLETSRSELEKEIAMELLECSLLTTISFAWVKGMIAKAMMAGMDVEAGCGCEGGGEGVGRCYVDGWG